MQNVSRNSGLITRLFGVWFAVVFGCSALTAILMVTFAPGAHRRRRIARNAAKFVFWCTGSQPEVSGTELLPGGAAVAIANHASYLDGILLTAVLPESYRFVIKREVTRVPVMHFLLRRIGAHFVERNDNHRGASDMRRIMQTASSGDSLAFFPEGTFASEPGLRRFKNGAFAIAVRGRLPLIPISILGTRAMLPADRTLPVPAALTVIIHEPLHPQADQEIADVIAYCRGRILESVGEPDLLEIIP